MKTRHSLAMIAGVVAGVFAIGTYAGAAEGVQASCNRACLGTAMNAYLQAVVRHDAAGLPVTRNVKYTENGVRLNLGDGLWQTAQALPTYRVDVLDEEAGQVGLLGRINENGNNNWYAARLAVEPDGRISEIEVLVNRTLTGGAPQGAGGAPPRQFAEPHPLMMQPIPAAGRLTRAELVTISDAYFTGLDTEEHSRGIHFSPECQRRENGNVMANNPDALEGSMARMGCAAQFDTGFSTIVTDIRERRFEVVDRTTGLAFGWGYFDHNGTAPQQQSDRPGSSSGNAFRQPFSFYIAEIFKVVDGNIRQIEAVLTTVPFQMESGW